MYELAEDNEALRDAHLAYAQSLLDASDADGAAEHLAAARAMARDGGGAIDGTLAVEEARLALLSGDTATAADRARVAVETLGAATDAQRIGDAYLVLARVQDSLGEIERAEQAYAAAIAAFERAGDRRALSRAHRYHGKFLKRLGRSEAALEAFERASDLAPSTAAGVPVAELL
jgi:tetratricopeptide (TPR) repeat protein